MNRTTIALTAILIAPQLAAAAEFSDAEKEAFLSRAEIVQAKKLDVGITGSKRATLSDGARTHDAHIQTVNEFKRRLEGPRGLELDFQDSYAFNVAAYRLDRMIGLGIVPVSVERKVKGELGSVTWWIDDVQMMALDRHKKEIAPPRPADYNDQMYNVRVFNELVFNTDANLGNILITNDWQIIPVDFTRAFRTMKALRGPKNLVKIDRRVYEGLRALTIEALEPKMGDLLSKPQLRGLIARRDLILAFFDEQIAAQGEAAVICDRPGH
jgi:hypothetical protein